MTQLNDCNIGDMVKVYTFIGLDDRIGEVVDKFIFVTVKYSNGQIKQYSSTLPCEIIQNKK